MLGMVLRPGDGPGRALPSLTASGLREHITSLTVVSANHREKDQKPIVPDGPVESEPTNKGSTTDGVEPDCCYGACCGRRTSSG
ncbi:hypothetical protein Hanom_Chr06g00509451 [Helianthus anomalus]